MAIFTANEQDYKFPKAIKVFCVEVCVKTFGLFFCSRDDVKS